MKNLERIKKSREAALKRLMDDKTKDTVVFCDLATPKQTFESYECGKNFDAYNELKCKLIEKGIPQEQIAYIHEAKKDNEKLNLFNKVKGNVL